MAAKVLRRPRARAKVGVIAGLRFDPRAKTVSYHGVRSKVLTDLEQRFLRVLLEIYPAPVPLARLRSILDGHESKIADLALRGIALRLRSKLPASLARRFRPFSQRGYVMSP